MPHLFISYRRLDSTDAARQLQAELGRVYGAAKVFRDTSSLVAGERFDTALQDDLKRSQVVLVLIGPKWASELQRRREAGETDYVEREVAQALQSGARVMPLLLGGASLPTPDSLPDTLKPLARLHTVPLRDDAWEADLNRIVSAIGRPVAWWALALRALVVLALLLVALYRITPDVTPLMLRLQVLAALGLYGAAEYGFILRRARRPAPSRQHGVD